MEPDDVPLVSGRSARLYCQFDAKPKAHVNWLKNGKPFVQRANGEKWQVHPDHLYLENVTPNDEGDYTCFADNGVGTAHHTYHLIIENNKSYPPTIDTGILHSRLDISIGENVTLECRFESIAADTFNWQRFNETLNDWVIIQNASSVAVGADPHFLNISNFSTSDTGNYSCWATNMYGPNSHQFKLGLLPEPAASRMPSRDLTVDIALGAAAVVALIVIVLTFFKMQEYKKNQITVVHAEQSFIIRRVVLEHDNGGKCLSPRVKIETETVNLNQLGAAEKKRALNEYQLPLDKDWEVARDKLVIGEKLGEGAFGVVFKATARALTAKDEASSTDVAIKMLKDSHTDSDLRDLVSEMEVMKKVGRHANIISLLGCVTQDGLFLLIS